MGFLKINQLKYSGKRYHFESPFFDYGLNIIEGPNGTGKTTFSDLLSYGLGLYVKQFNRKEKVIHEEICNDTENFVILDIEISSKNYVLKRYFNDATIFVEDEQHNIEVYPINRIESNQFIFSDWFLSKLDIEVVEIFQGSKKFKIGLLDLFRLIHHDQNTSPQQIYKDHKTPNNFIADSLFIRKVIFELLTGYQFSQYYSLLGKLNSAEKKKEASKATLDNYSEVAFKLGYRSDISVNHIQEQILKLEDQLLKLNLYRQTIKEKPASASQLQLQIQELQKKFLNIESQINKFRSTHRSLSNELKNLSILKQDIILEVTQIKKILSTQKHLDIFSINMCPCCLKVIERKEDHCICGNLLGEDEYERYFYSSEEYLNILKSKQKSVLTVEQAIGSCEEEIEDIHKQLFQIEEKRDLLKVELEELQKENEFHSIDFELSWNNNKILEINELLQDNKNKLGITKEYENLEKNYNNDQNVYGNLRKEVQEHEFKLGNVIESTLSKFNSVYNDLMVGIADDIESAEIAKEDYMPIINGGVYKQASSNVQKRLMYFLSLLKLSLENERMPFPRFLLIDTPENLGIDKDNLDKCLEKIIGVTKNGKYQVILTTGIDKYPENLKSVVKMTLGYQNKLLKKRP